LPLAPIQSIAVLRLDGDLYESTMDTLTHLYPKVSPGGFVIVDDHGAFPPCAEAVADYRRDHGIKARW
jgi:Macrocin-O-methyltransferase (TylF).